MVKETCLFIKFMMRGRAAELATCKYFGFLGDPFPNIQTSLDKNCNISLFCLLKLFIRLFCTVGSVKSWLNCH